MPHAEKPTDEYEGALETLEDAVRQARRQQKRSILGVDANAVIGRRSEHNDARIIGPWGLGVRNERGVLFGSWAQLNRLRIVNTFYQKQDEYRWTHRLANTGQPRQIDYVLIDIERGFGMVDAQASDDIVTKSDHRCVNVELKLLVKTRTKKKKRHEAGSGKGRWHPVLDGEGKPIEYHRALDAELTPHADLNAQTLTRSTRRAAEATSKNHASHKDIQIDGAGAKLQELIAATRAAASPE